MTKAKNTDPLAVVEDAVNAAIATAKDNQEKFAQAIEAEAEKAQKAALEGLDQAVSAHHANIDALVAATKAAFDGFAKIGELAKTQAAEALESRTADVKTVLATKDPKEAVTVQVELAKAAQKQATAAAEALADAGREVASEVAKPVEAQVAANLKTLSEMKVA